MLSLAEPSPTSAITGRLPNARPAPTAAGNAKPSAPPAPQKKLLGLVRETCSHQEPNDGDSDVKAASGGHTCASTSLNCFTVILPLPEEDAAGGVLMIADLGGFS